MTPFQASTTSAWSTQNTSFQDFSASNPLKLDNFQLNNRATAPQEIVFIDRGVSDYAALAAGVTGDRQVVLLDSTQDAIAQITATLAGQQNISAIHILSHGNAGGLQFGSSSLNLENLSVYQTALHSWANALTNDADILLYGCDVASNELGQAFIQILSQSTGADVAASTNLTGSTALGGDWNFEVNTGAIATQLAFHAETIAQYNYTFLNLDQYNNLKSGITNVLNTLQLGVDALALGQNLPLVGNKLKDTEDFFYAVRDTIATALSGINGSDETVIGTTLTTALIGAGLLPSGASVGVTTTADQVEFTMNIQRELLASSTTIDFDLGLPAIGLDVTANVNAASSYSFRFTVGIDLNTDEFYLNTQAGNELNIGIDVTTPGLNATGQLGILQVNAQDNATDPTRFNGSFAIDLRDFDSDNRLTAAELSTIGSSQLISPILDADANVNLVLTTSFGGSSVFPSLQTDFSLDWAFNPTDSNLSGGLPAVAFNNVRLNLGSFFSDFVSPIAAEVKNVLDPIQPVLDVLNTRMPVLSDIGLLRDIYDQNSDGKVSLVEFVGKSTGHDAAVRFINAISQFKSFIDAIPTGVGDVYIPLGNLRLNESSGTDLRSLTNLSSLGITNFDDLLTTLPGVDTATRNILQGFQNQVGNNRFGGGLAFPILQNPTTAFGLLLGRDVSLFTFDLPTLEVNFNVSQFFPILGPLGVRLAGNFNARADFAFGYDTFGIRRFATALTDGDPSTTADPSMLFDGFFVSDTDRPDGTFGTDVPEIQLNASITASGELNVIVAAAGVGGGIFANVNFDLRDPNTDGKVRLNELVDGVLARGPLGIFNTSGKLEAGLNAYVRVGLDIPFVGFVGWEDSYDIARVTLLDFDFGAADLSPNPVLAEIDNSLGAGTLRLNMGAFAANRVTGNTIDGDETFQVTRSEDGTKILVTAFGYTQEFNASQVTRIYAEGGIGNDVINVAENVVVPVELWGDFKDPNRTEFGNDRLFAGAAAAQLYGGGGNDQLTARAGNSLLLGGTGNDTLFGGTGNDSMEGGDGDDRLYGNAGNDTLSGGENNDILEAGDGNDVLDGQAGNDRLKGGAGNDALLGGTGNDVLEGGTESDRLEGGDQNDYLLGDIGNLNADGSVSLGGGTGNDTLLGGAGNDALYGQAGNDSLLGGTEADFLVGGAGNDFLDGNQGNDALFGDDGQRVTLGGGAVRYESPNSTATGNDTLYGSEGQDIAIGGAGNDQLFGNVANPADADIALIGDDGAVTLNADGSFSRIESLYPNHTGNDTILGANNVTDNIIGGSGNDSITAGTGDVTDILLGDNGIIYGANAGGDANDIFSVATTFDGQDTISGNGGNDIILGGSGSDSLSGNSGNDILLGDGGRVTRDASNTVQRIETDPTASTLGGNDTINDTEGQTIALGGAGNDSITTGDGADWIVGDNGEITFSGGQFQRLRTKDVASGGNDAIVAGNGADTVLGGTGNDTISGGSDNAADILFGDNGAVVGADGSAQANDIFSTDPTVGGQDSITGGGGNDIIIGGSGGSDIAGNLGDRLFGNEGDDVIAGDNAYIARNSSNVIQFIETTYLDTVTGNRFYSNQGGNDLLEDTQGNSTLLGGNGSDTLTAGNGFDVLVGDQGELLFTSGQVVRISTKDPANGGNDVMTAGNNDDTVFGGTGNDTISGGSDNADDILFGDNGVVVGADGSIQANDLFSTDPTLGGRDSILGVGGNDTIVGGSGGSDATGVGGDRLFGNAGEDVILGDNAYITRDINNLIESIDTTYFDSVQGQTYANIGGDDWLEDTDGNSILLGGNGNDTITSGNGADLIIGDNGRITYSNAILQRIQTTAAQFGGNDSITAGNNTDTVLGGTGSDSISGGADDANDILLGDNGVVVRSDGTTEANDIFSTDPTFGGQDTITGGGGDDTIVGGSGGNDTTGTGGDRLLGGTGNDVVFGDNAYITRNAADVIEVLESRFANQGGDDFLDGEQGDDRLIGGTGNDTIVGNLGNDTILGDNGRLNYNLDENLATIDIITTTDSTIGGNDLITGDSGNDIALGGAGNDTISGNLGNDSLLGDNGQIIFMGGVISRIETLAPDVGGSDVIHGNEDNDIALGGAAGDSITGDTGNDILLGDNGLINYGIDSDLTTIDLIQTTDPAIGGNDTINGGDGADTALGGAANDRITGDAGNDKLLGDNGQILLTNGLLRRLGTTDPGIGGSDEIDGNDGDDLIAGGFAGDTIRGGNGEDRILGDNGLFDYAYAGDATVAPDSDLSSLDFWTTTNPTLGGNDRILAGLGNDTVLGGTGDDQIDGDEGLDVNAPSFPRATSPQWLLAGQADFNGDGWLDLVYHNRTSGNGQVMIWLMQGTTVQSEVMLSRRLAFPWKLAGVGDFNGDGHADLMWQETRSRQFSIWFLNGGRYRSSATVIAPTNRDWQIVGVGDFNGDKKADLLWRDMRRGHNTLWLMSGARSQGSIALRGFSDMRYQIQAVADVNGDKKVDIIWRNSTNGGTAAWLFNGTRYLGGTGLAGQAGGQWRIAASGDFNKDGRADLLWQDSGTGRVTVWLNGTAANQRVELQNGIRTNDLLLGDQGKVYEKLPIWRNAFSIDTAAGNGGNDTIAGNQGDDLIIGQQGNDRLLGQAGEDDIIGGHNVIGGADGNDYIDGGAHADVAIGDNGLITRRSLGYHLWQRYPEPFADVMRDVDRYDHIDQVVGNDTIFGDTGDDILYGQGGNDSVRGGAGDDEVMGGLGNDTLTGDDGMDTVLGDDGLIIRSYNSDGSPRRNRNGSWHRDVVLTDVGTVSALGNSLDRSQFTSLDQLLVMDSTNSDGSSTFSYYAADRLPDGNDLMDGGAGEDNLFGQGGNDTITGGTGNDYVQGNSGNDRLSGDAGDDLVIGDNGANLTSVKTDLPLVTQALHVIDQADGSNLALDPFGVIVTPTTTVTPHMTFGLFPSLSLNPPLQRKTSPRPVMGDLRTNDGRSLSLLLSIVPDLANHMNQLSGQDSLFGGAGRDLLVGDDYSNVMPLGTGNASVDDQIHRVSRGLYQLIYNLHDVELVNSVGRANRTLNLGNDQLDGGDDDDHVIGDNGLVYGPFAQTSVNSAGLNQLTRLGQAIAQVSGQVEGLLPATSMATKPYRLVMGQDTVLGGNGNDKLFGDGSVTIAPVLNSLTYRRGSFWNYRVDGANRPGRANFRDFDLEVGNDSLDGGNGHDLIAADQTTLINPIVTAPAPRNAQEELQLRQSLALVIQDIQTFVRNLHIDNYGILRHDRDQFNAVRAGNDSLSGGAGDDFMLGDQATFSLPFLSGQTNLRMNLTKDYLDYSEEAHTFFGALPHQYEYIYRRPVAGPTQLAQDSLSGGDGNDILLGLRDRDRLFGNAGDDRLFGSSNADVLDGGTGQNLIRNTNPSPSDRRAMESIIRAQLTALLSPTQQRYLLDISQATSPVGLNGQLSIKFPG